MIEKVKELYKKVKEILTPERRKAIYGLMAAISIASGIITTEQLNETAATLVSISTSLTILLAFVNTKPKE